jgi:hypothetical protein
VEEVVVEVQGSVPLKMSTHGTFPRVEVAVLAKSLHRRIRAYTACVEGEVVLALAKSLHHRIRVYMARVEKVVVLAKSLLRWIQAHTALAEDSGGGGVLHRIRAYTAHVDVEEMVVFSIVEYERIWRGGGFSTIGYEHTRLMWRRWCWQRVEYERT